MMGGRMTAKTTRMSIDILAKDHKRLKVIAAAEGVTAMEQARKGKTTKVKDFDDLCDHLGL